MSPFQIALRRVDKRIHVNGKDIPDPVTSFEQLGRRKTVNPALLRNVTEVRSRIRFIRIYESLLMDGLAYC